MRTSVKMNKRSFSSVWVFVLLALSILSGQPLLAQNAQASWSMHLPFHALDLAVNPRTNIAVATDIDGRWVAVVDLNTHKVLSLLEPGEGTRVVAINSATNRAYVTTGEGITVLDLSGNRVVGRIANLRIKGEETLFAGIALDERTNTAVVTHTSGRNGRSDFVSKIDLHQNTVLGTVEAGPASSSGGIPVAVNPLTNEAAVINKPSKSLLLMDLTSMGIEDRVALEFSPVAVAINPYTNVAVVAEVEPKSKKGRVVLVDLTAGQVQILATIDVGNDPTAVAVNPRTNQAIVARGDGQDLLVLDLSLSRTVRTIPGSGGLSRALVMNPETDTVTFLKSVDKVSTMPISENRFVPAGGEQVVYVVDEPEPGREDQFTNLPDAVAALCQSADGGAVVIDTSRTLQVESLNLPCPVQIRSGEGIRGTLQGPGNRPLEMAGRGAVGLIGLNISNGMQPIAVRTGGDAEVRTCAIASPLQVQVGESASDSQAIAGGLPGKLRLIDNQLAITDVTVAMLLDEMTILNNRPLAGSQPDLTVQGREAAARVVEGSTIKVSENKDLNGIIVKGLTLEANTEVEVGLNRLLGPLKLNVKEEGEAKYNIKKNKVSAEFNFELNGTGLPTVTFDENDIGKDSFFGFSVEGVDLDASNSNFAEGLAMKLLSPLRSFKHKSNKVKVEGTWNITGEGLTASDVDLQLLELPLVKRLELKLEDVSLNVLAHKVFLGSAGLTLGKAGGTVGTFNVKFDQDSTVDGPFGGTLKSGKAKIESTSTIFKNTFTWDVEGGLEWKNGTGVVYNGGVDIQTRGVNASVKVDSTGNAKFKAGVRIKDQFRVGVSAEFKGNEFEGGLMFNFIGSGMNLNQALQSDGEIIISNNTFRGSMHVPIDVRDAPMPVKIENNTITTEVPFGIIIAVERAPFNVIITKNTISMNGGTPFAIVNTFERPVGGRIIILDNTVSAEVAWNFGSTTGADEIRIEDNRFTVTPGTAGFAKEKSVTFRGNTLAGGGGFVVVGVDSCTIQDNSLPGYFIQLNNGLGSTCVQTMGNTAGFLFDLCSQGCLANDPGNNNIDPEHISSPIDFDGNGCPDYPPDCNRRGRDGRCGCGPEPAPGPCTLP